MYQKIINAINKRIQTLSASEEAEIIDILSDYDSDDQRAEQISELLDVNYNCVYDLLILTV